MKISDILCQMGVKEYKIYNEQEFERLQLVAHESKENACIFIDDEKYLSELKECVSMVICTKEMDIKKILTDKRGVCVIENARIMFFQIHNFLMGKETYCRKKEENQIAKSAMIAQSAVIAKHNVIIGENVVIEDMVVIKENTKIGDNTVIRSGSVIGNIGYEFKKNGKQIIPVVHGGGVEIGENVVVGANVVIDKAVYPWDNTLIGDESKIDSLVFVAHGVKVGKGVMLVAQALVAGRSILEDKVKIGPGAVIRNAITIEEGANISMGSVVTRNVESNTTVSGNFAIPHDKFMKHVKDISK